MLANLNLRVYTYKVIDSTRLDFCNIIINLVVIEGAIIKFTSVHEKAIFDCFFIIYHK